MDEFWNCYWLFDLYCCCKIKCIHHCFQRVFDMNQEILKELTVEINKYKIKVSFNNLVKKSFSLHESLLRSLWKVWKCWKNWFFCQYLKSDFFKSFEYMMLVVSLGCNKPIGFLRNWISSSYPRNAKTPHF